MGRVVITGFGLLSPIGNTAEEVTGNLVQKKSGIIAMPEFEELDGIGSHVAGIVKNIDVKRIARKYRRSMGRVAQLMALAAIDAVQSSGLPAEMLSHTRCGVSAASTMGSGAVLEEIFLQFAKERTVHGHKSTSFLQIMSHTCAANLALMFATKGLLLASSTACASSSQSIGLAYQAIKMGQQDIMITGGADEMHWTSVATFDVMQGTSQRYNKKPTATPRPFDRDRDGLVVAEGAGCLILEDLEHALKRSAHIYGEVESFFTNSDGFHMSSPSTDGMVRCMAGALESATLTPADIPYINAHATGTIKGDLSEAEAVRSSFPESIRISSTKSYTGHTFGACGAIEIIFGLLMMEHGFMAPTINLENIDPLCGGMNHLADLHKCEFDRFMSNNFAFGGVNTSLIVKQFTG